MDLLERAIDVHVHSAPGVADRHSTDLAIAREARTAGMDGVVLKNHVVSTADRAALVNEAVGEEILYGGVVLNGAVGGLNPDAVDATMRLGGKIVWLPTLWNANHARREREDGNARAFGQRVPAETEELALLSGGEIRPVVQSIVDLVAANDAVLATGHADLDETFAVVRACADSGARCLVDHPFSKFLTADIDVHERLADMGAILEYCALSLQLVDGLSVSRMAETIGRVGPSNCVLASDFGQPRNPPVSGFRAFLQSMLETDLAAEDVRAMVTDQPATLLGL